MSSSKSVVIIVGTRPNFIKISQFPKVFSKYKENFTFSIIHTGQHMDEKMSDVFFKQFAIAPDIILDIDRSSPVTQIATIMLQLEDQLKSLQPSLVVVVGDVTSTLAASITANKMNIPVAHVESGLRSFDRTMPEEINRIVTDAITDYFFVTEESGLENLKREGVADEKIFFVGNTMIDTLMAFTGSIDKSPVLEQYGLKEKQYALVTMHRPATVDSEEGLKMLIRILRHISNTDKIVFPIHPRTLNQLSTFGLKDEMQAISGLVLCEPLDYFAFQKLAKNAAFIVTDSGGIQEESTYYGVPCLTLRPNTERPSTITIGTNELIPLNMDLILSKIDSIKKGTYKKGAIPPLWDGRSSERIADAIKEILE